MKLYTEEQVNFAMRYATVTKDSYSEVLKQLIPIELPSDEEIKEKSYNKFIQSNAQICFQEGANWVINRILKINHLGGAFY